MPLIWLADKPLSPTVMLDHAYINLVISSLTILRLRTPSFVPAIIVGELAKWRSGRLTNFHIHWVAFVIIYIDGLTMGFMPTVYR